MDTIKSSRSIMFVPAPSGWKPDHTLNPRIHGILKTVIRRILIPTALVLFHPNRSIQKETMFSKTPTMVDSAAQNKNRKNKEPQIRPPAICVKMFGSVMNTSPGPASGSTPKAKQEGITISPAISATQVSRSTMLRDSPARERFLSK